MSVLLDGRFRFDNYVVGASNRLAAAAGRAVAESPGASYNPLFIYGGRSRQDHLLQAIGHYVAQRLAPHEAHHQLDDEAEDAQRDQEGAEAHAPGSDIKPAVGGEAVVEQAAQHGPVAMPRLPAMAVPPITVPIIFSGKFSRAITA